MEKIKSQGLARRASVVNAPSCHLMMPVLLLLAMLGSHAADAQSCPAPWNAGTVYGTVRISSQDTVSGNGVTLTENQNVVTGLKMTGTAGSCGWGSTGPTTSLNAAINDTWTLPCSNGSGTETISDQAAGKGFPAGGSLGLSPALGYQFSVNGTINTTYTETGCGSTTTNTIPAIWGPASGVYPNFISISQTPVPGVLSGSTSYKDATGDDPALTGLKPLWVVDWNFSPKPDDTCKTCKKKLARISGTTIANHNQSLGKDIPIAGTPFGLHYESERQAGRANADAVATAHAKQLGGWTLNAHHALEQQLLSFCFASCLPYAVVPKALYLGDGGVRSDFDVQAPVILNKNIYLTSEDGEEVYEFDGTTGAHVRTLRPMTGAVMYTFGYDANHRLSSVTDASGNVTTIDRDSAGNPTMIVAPFGQITTLAVDGNGFLSQITDPLGHSTKLTNSSQGLLTGLTDPSGKVYAYKYDIYGRLTSHADPAGGFLNLTRTDNTNGFTVAEISAMNVKSSYQAVFSSTATSATQQYINTWPNGLQATKTETQAGGQLSESSQLPDGTSASTMMTADPRWGIQVPVEKSSSLSLGNLTMTRAGSRAATLGTAGDPFSFTTQTDTETINGRKYTSVFTTSNLNYLDTSPAGRTTKSVLDSLERPSSLQVGTLAAVQLAYDSHGRLSTLTQGTRKSSFTYDSNGFLNTITDALGLTTTYTHDAAGHVLTEKLADGRVTTFSYDANGNLISLMPPGKQAHKFAYNVVNSFSSYTPPLISGTGATTYAFDKDQNLTLITRPDGNKISFKYDSAGRLSSLVAPTETVNYTYDTKTGNLAGAATPNGESIVYVYNGPLPASSTWTGAVAGSVSRTFNNNFWIVSQTPKGGSTINFTYDNDGLVTQAGALTLKSDANGFVTGTTLGSITDTRTYNSFGELTGYSASYKTTVLYSATYTRDADGRVASKNETIGGTAATYNYTYDQAGRLTQVKKNNVVSSTYSNDSNSNRLSATTQSGTSNGTYDAQDRLLTYGASSFTYTANGEMATQTTGSQKTTYVYDVLGNLTSVTLPSGTKLTYIVDPENHRVAKQVNGTQQTGFLYEGDHIVALLNAGNQIVSQFVYATGSTTPDYMINGGVLYRIISDQLGSPRLVVNATTGVIEERMDYDEFGNVLADSNAGFQPFGFAGGIKDPDTGLVRFGARDYNPVTGRWVAKDPILFMGGDSNLYGYVLSDPVNLIDSRGLSGEDCTCHEEKHFTGEEVALPITQVGGIVGIVKTGPAEVIVQTGATIAEVGGVSELRMVDYVFGLGILKGSPELQDTTVWQMAQEGVNQFFAAEVEHGLGICIKKGQKRKEKHEYHTLAGDVKSGITNLVNGISRLYGGQ